MELPDTYEWNGQTYHVPSEEELQAMVSNGVAETPDGEMVEPGDPNSWISLLGLQQEGGES